MISSLKLGALVLICFFIIPPLSKADTFTVTNLNNSGDGSLRQAIIDANNNAGDDDIVFQAGLSGTIPNDGAEFSTFTSSMQISGGLTITGPGADDITIDAQSNDRIIIISGTGAVVSISGIRFINGLPEAGGGGALFNEGNLTIDSCVFEDNQIRDAGGAIFVEGRSVLEVTNTVFNSNLAGFEGGAIASDGTIMKIENCLFSNNNTTTNGGAIYQSQETLIEEISKTTFIGNVAADAGDVSTISKGGAIFNAGTINLISQSTFSANKGIEGGAIFNAGGSVGIGQIINCTFSGNIVQNVPGGTNTTKGGAIFNNSDMTISFSTIANNVATEGGGIFENGSSIEIRNSIVAFNNRIDIGDNCNEDIEMGSDETNNYSNNNDCGFGNISMTPGDLGPLADNGGPTETLALLDGQAVGGASAMCDPLDSDGMATGMALTVDQRGFPRPAPGETECDSGAFETQPVGELTIEKITVPEGGDDFEFTGTGFPEGCGLMGTFTLDDMESISCMLPPDEYTVSETVPSGFELDIMCTKPPESETDTSVTIDLEVDEQVTCTFTNTADFTLSLTIEGDGGGTVRITPPGETCEPDCSQGYEDGTEVTLTPNPDSLSEFDGISGDDGCGENITMTEDLNCIATFSLRQVTLDVTIAGTGGGTVNITPPNEDCEPNCEQTYDAGTDLVLTPMPDSLSEFDGFTGDPECAANINITEDLDCTATFSPRPVTLNLTIAGEGGGKVNINPPDEDCEPNCMQTYNAGTDLVLTPMPDSLSEFDGFSGDPECAENIDITEDLNCIATFSLRQVTLDVEFAGDGNGKVEIIPPGELCAPNCMQTYNAGTDVILIPIPGPLSQFDGFSGDGCSANINITEDIDCTATFSLRQVTLNVNITGTGTGTVFIDPPGETCEPDCTHVYDAGTNITLTPTAGPDSAFIGFTGGRRCRGNFRIINDITCAANFAELPEILLFNGQPAQGGTVFRNSANKVKIAAATPNKNVRLIWGFKKGNGTVTTNKCGNIPVNITPNQTLANFKANGMGMVNKKFSVPSTSANKAFFQAVDLFECDAGPVVEAFLVN